jgi:hypothetical protein
MPGLRHRMAEDAVPGLWRGVATQGLVPLAGRGGAGGRADCGRSRNGRVRRRLTGGAVKLFVLAVKADADGECRSARLDYVRSRPAAPVRQPAIRSRPRSAASWHPAQPFQSRKRRAPRLHRTRQTGSREDPDTTTTAQFDPLHRDRSPSPPATESAASLACVHSKVQWHGLVPRVRPTPTGARTLRRGRIRANPRRRPIQLPGRCASGSPATRPPCSRGHRHAPVGRVVCRSQPHR